MSLNIDIHNHFVPGAVFETMQRGRDWYGARLEKNARGETRIVVNGIVLPPQSEEGLRLLNVAKFPEERIKKAKEMQLDLQVTGIAAWFMNYHLDAKTGAAYCREVNEELAALERNYPANFRGMAMLPWQDTDAALKELDYAVRDLKLRAVYVATNINGRDLDDPGFGPIFEALASKGIPLFCFPAHPVLSQEERMSRYAFAVSIGAPVEATLALMSVVFGGVLDRNPGLKMCFFNGGGFAVYNLGRLSFAYHSKPEARIMARPPEEYIRQVYYDSQVYGAETLKFLVDRVSADNVLLGTDFPLGWYVSETVSWLAGMPFLSGEAKAKILGLNAARLLGIEV
ncbi:amidohydrolase family protein [Chloroflexota bacterium]